MEVNDPSAYFCHLCLADGIPPFSSQDELDEHAKAIHPEAWARHLELKNLRVTTSFPEKK